MAAIKKIHCQMHLKTFTIELKQCSNLLPYFDYFWTCSCFKAAIAVWEGMHFDNDRTSVWKRLDKWPGIGNFLMLGGFNLKTI